MINAFSAAHSQSHRVKYNARTGCVRPMDPAAFGGDCSYTLAIGPLLYSRWTKIGPRTVSLQSEVWP